MRGFSIKPVQKLDLFDWTGLFSTAGAFAAM
jgi:hypothetical protein